MKGLTEYVRPLVQTGPARPDTALALAGGACWFTHVEILSRSAPPVIVPVADMPETARQTLTTPRPPIAGLSMDRPRIMGILNVTPDSFSDGGAHAGPARAVSHGRAMVAQGADIIDIGGESTRPGAITVPEEAELARVEPVIRALYSSIDAPISIDTRKAMVAKAAVTAGAALVNDVSGFTYDKALAPYCAQHQLPVCVMHALGDPETMQDNPQYADVLLDIYDFLQAQICMLVEAGIPRHRIIADPGIGFGKTLAHNLTLLHNLSLFHGLGVPILLGASRKGFIRTIGQAPNAEDRAPGSIAVALAAVAQGVQILRVHDVTETKQALRLWQAVESGEHDGA
ncbi:dihydropteroate synthase [Primorskyibacter aestuariivivens]|uniref:dihydropteroate synthase n=1 Tax=Primorskyibacter aestuariivivens TaxID=1888912 RepID=UPI002300F662|nr:dihydropteroate synthase [Primorskyibacter aestuariivivens]MDA7427056.1 dihydropteroate synthase [Primorskyibacter aestuariivivens]